MYTGSIRKLYDFMDMLAPTAIFHHAYKLVNLYLCCKRYVSVGTKLIKIINK